MAEKRCLEANKNTNLVSSRLINNGKQITPQLPSTGNQKCDLMQPGSHYSVRTLPPTTTLGTSDNPESFPEKLLLCLQAVTNEGNYRTSTATLDLSQGISDGSQF